MLGEDTPERASRFGRGHHSEPTVPRWRWFPGSCSPAAGAAGSASTRPRLVLDGETLARRMATRLGAVCDPVFEVGRGVSGLPSVTRAARRRRVRSPRSRPVVTPCASAGRGRAGVAGRRRSSCVIGIPVLELLRDWPGAPTAVPEADGRLQPVCARYGPDELLAADEPRDRLACARCTRSST